MVSQISQDVLVPMVPEWDPKRFTFVQARNGDPITVTQEDLLGATAESHRKQRQLSDEGLLALAQYIMWNETCVVRQVEFREGGYCTVISAAHDPNVPNAVRDALERVLGQPVRLVPPSLHRTMREPRGLAAGLE